MKEFKGLRSQLIQKELHLGAMLMKNYYNVTFILSVFKIQSSTV